MGKEDFKDLAGVTDDDNSPEKDIDLDDDEQEVDLEELMATLNADDDSDDSDDDSEKDDDTDNNVDDTDEEGTGDEEAELPDNVDEIVQQRVTAELNRIIPDRLKRDPTRKKVANLEHITGMSIDAVTEQVINNMVESKAEELGITEDEARKIINNQIQLAGNEAQKNTDLQQKADIDEAMRQVKYSEDKLSCAKKPKLARVLTKDILKDIDAFTQNGKVLTFEDGMKYVLGEKFATGELLQKVQAGAEKKAQKNIQQRGKATPQNKTTGSAKSETSILTKEQIAVARNLGITSKDDLAAYAKEINQQAKSKQRRGR